MIRSPTSSKAGQRGPKYSSRYEGATYYFASREDKAEFDKTPAKYAPQYSGFCANKMRQRKLADIDPTQFLSTVPDAAMVIVT